MPNDCAALGSMTRMLMLGGDLPRTFGGTRVDFLYETLSSNRGLDSKNHITGTRSHYSSGVREKSYVVSGTIAFHPSPTQLAQLLPYILGGTASGTSFPIADPLPSVDFLVERENGLFRYTEMLCAQAILRGRSAQGGEEPELVELITHWVGKAERIDLDSFPGSPPAIANGTLDLVPYTFSNCALTINSVTRYFDAFNLLIDNRLMVRMRNSLTATCIRATDRLVRLQVTGPFTESTLGDAEFLNTTPYGGVLTLTNASVATTFTFPSLLNVFKTPTAKNKGEMPLELNLEAYRTTGSAEIVVTNDSTP